MALGQALGACGLVRAAIDISDGIASDLARICEKSELGAELWANHIPVSRALKKVSKTLGISPLDIALTGGEDFELLWTVPKKNEAKVLAIATDVLGHMPFRIGKQARECF